MTVSQNKLLLSKLEDLILSQQQAFYFAKNKSEDPEALNRTLSQCKQLTNSLKENILSLERTSLKELLIILHQTIFAKTQKVDFSFSGEDIEVDNENYPFISQLLSKVVENFLEEGMESDQERALFDKPPLSSLSIKISSKYDEIFIDISDDGRGLDPLKITQAILKQNMLSKNDLQNLSQDDLFQLFFSPKEVIDEGSNATIQSLLYQLDGRVKVASKPGFGTKFTCIFPLKTNITRGLVVSLNQEFYVIPQRFVKMIHKIDEADAIHLVHLSERTEDNKFIIRLCVGSHQFGLVVDSVFNTEEIVIKQACLKPYICGTTILTNGKSALVIDPKALKCD